MQHTPRQQRPTLPTGFTFLPDATVGVVRALDAADLEAVGTRAVVMNTFHLMQKPGSTVVTALGGLHRMSSWNGLIVTDSGGFQAYSLIHENPRNGSITNDGILFRPENDARTVKLTPEKSIQLQISYGADIVICLDDCTHVDADEATQVRAVERTIAWAKRCRQTFDTLMEQKRIAPENQPYLFGVIQGGASRELRKRCAEALLEIGFDGYGYGGWPLDGKGQLLEEMLTYLRELIPAQFPLHALGVGHPYNVAACARMGYALFDSAMPTRDARHHRLYTFANDGERADAGLSGEWLEYLYMNDVRHLKDDRPVSPYCDALCCTRYTRGYLHHLFKLGDALFLRLATMHNMRFMNQLTARLDRVVAQHAT